MMMFKLLFWTGCYSLLSVTEQVTAETEISCSSEPVVSFCGSSIVLQCHLEPQQDATDNTVKWTQQSDVVHICKGGKDVPGEQMEKFEGRTSLFSEGLHKGNLSLQLSSLKLSDSGRYKCCFQVGSVEKSCYVGFTVRESEVIVSPDPVTAESGQDVVLPCRLDPPFDVTPLTVEWRWKKTTVHVYRNQKDDNEDQDQRFKGRTSLLHDEMIHGNISLKLRKVTEEDAGIYTCFVPGLNCQVKKGNIDLKVVLKEEDPKKKGINDPDSTQTPPSSDPPDLQGLVVGLNVAAVLVLVILIAGIVCYKRTRFGRWGHKAVLKTITVELEEDKTMMEKWDKTDERTTIKVKPDDIE